MCSWKSWESFRLKQTNKAFIVSQSQLQEHLKSCLVSQTRGPFLFGNASHILHELSELSQHSHSSLVAQTFLDFHGLKQCLRAWMLCLSRDPCRFWMETVFLVVNRKVRMELIEGTAECGFDLISPQILEVMQKKKMLIFAAWDLIVIIFFSAGSQTPELF